MASKMSSPAARLTTFLLLEEECGDLSLREEKYRGESKRREDDDLPSASNNRRDEEPRRSMTRLEEPERPQDAKKSSFGSDDGCVASLLGDSSRPNLREERRECPPSCLVESNLREER